MAILTYTSERNGFGVTYDGAWITHVDDPADPRLSAAWAAHIPAPIAGSVLFLPRGAAATDVALGRAPSQLITTDHAPVAPKTLSTWDWDEVTRAHAGPFLERTGIAALEATAIYWRGFPVLQLSAIPSGDGDEASRACPAPIEVLGTLSTPAQTFSSLLTMPLEAVEEWGARFQVLMDGFYLVPIEREGRVRTGHQYVRSVHVQARDLRDDLAAR